MFQAVTAGVGVCAANRVALPDTVRKRAATLAKGGYSMRQIGKILADEGWTNGSGKPLAAGSVHFLIRKPVPAAETVVLPPWYLQSEDEQIGIGLFQTKKDAERAAVLIEHAKTVIDSRNSSPLDIAAEIKKLSEAKLLQKEIALALGQRESWVSFINTLNAMPEELLDYLRDGTVKATTLVKAYTLYGAFQTEWFLKRIKASLAPGTKISGRYFFEQTDAFSNKERDIKNVA